MRKISDAGFNSALYIGRYSLITASAQLIPAALIQSFFLRLGIGTAQIGLFGTVNSVMMAAGLFAFSGIADKYSAFTSFRRAAALALWGYCANAVALLAVVLMGAGVKPGVKFAFFAAATGLHSLLTSLSSIFEATAPVRLLARGTKLGRVYGISGVAAGAVGVVCGFAVNTLLNGSPENAVAVLSLCSLAVLVPASLSTLIFRPVETLNGEVKSHGTQSPFAVVKDMLSLRSFRAMLAPNLLRALQYSVVYFAPAIGLARFENSDALTGLLAIALPAATFTGCLLLSYVEPKIGSGRLLLAGAALSAAGCVCIAFAPTIPLYALSYYALFLGQTVIDYAFPLGTLKIAPPEAVGRYNSVRLLIYMLANALFVWLSGITMGIVSPKLLLCANTAVLLLFGMLFARAYRKYINL